MPMGINFANWDPFSTGRLVREVIVYPLAASTTYLLSGADISATTAGATFTVATPGVSSKPLQYPRRITVTSHDNSGTNLSITLLITGKRFGATVSESLTATGAGGGETKTTTAIFDEVDSIKCTAIANNAASDTVSVGLGGNVVGLQHRITKVQHVKKLMKIANGTPDAAGCVAPATLQVASKVLVSGSGLDVNAIFSAGLAVTDIYIVEYHAAGLDKFVPSGWRA